MNVLVPYCPAWQIAARLPSLRPQCYLWSLASGFTWPPSLTLSPVIPAHPSGQLCLYPWQPGFGYAGKRGFLRQEVLTPSERPALLDRGLRPGCILMWAAGSRAKKEAAA